MNERKLKMSKSKNMTRFEIRDDFYLAHRNGVPIYGTLFYNWSSSIKDQEHFAETLKEDSEGSKTFPDRS